MIRRDELPLYSAELAVTVIYASLLHQMDRRYAPNWTWLVVMIGVLISAAPSIILARDDPATQWQDYERRAAAGFLVSGCVVISWQLWQMAERRGRSHGYALSRRITPENPDHANPSSPLE